MKQRMRGEETCVQKTIQIQNEKTKVVHEFKMRIQYLPLSREINMSRAICELHSHGLKLMNSHIFYQDVEREMYVFMGTYPFDKQILIRLEIFPAPYICLKYKKLSILESSPHPSKEFLKPESKKNQLRTIGQVVSLVRQWKTLCAKTDSKGQKVHTSESAATMLKVNKKTLHDYAYQINLGEFFSFNFEKNKNLGIGVLRQFIRAKKKQMAVFNNTDNYWFSPDSEEDSHNH